MPKHVEVIAVIGREFGPDFKSTIAVKTLWDR